MISPESALLDILDDRYGRAATMLISQFPVDTWHARFPDQPWLMPSWIA
jgi:hypothetical protein